jgi:hypothetical protein
MRRVAPEWQCIGDFFEAFAAESTRTIGEKGYFRVVPGRTIPEC